MKKQKENIKQEDLDKVIKVDRNYSLIKEIQKHPLYRKTQRDARARSMIHEALQDVQSTKNQIMPGQLLMFNYLNPKTKEELEYYDAMPCTIFFGVFNSEQGKRVIGFNIHYYPPKFRYQIMNRIFEMYRPVYSKYFGSGISKDMEAFDYAYLIDMLNKYNLSFGVRMYDPKLIGGVMVIPPKEWPTAMFTEGHFKKETRARIMQLWTEDSIEKGKYKNIRGAKYNRKR